MYPFAHFFITYLVINCLIPETQKYIVFILLFSIILDFDHVPSYFRLAIKLKNKEKVKIWDEKRVDRSFLQGFPF